jgi:small-conductance mechanosensitive channel
VVAGTVIARVVVKMLNGILTTHLTTHALQLSRRVIFYGILTIFIISALRELGFELTLLLGAAGILSVAIGFASQTSASNLISGLFLLGEKPFSVGDIIQVDAVKGEVLSIDFLSVKLRTFDNLFVRIPNETLIKTTFTNISRFPIRRLDLAIGVAYKENIARVRELLIRAADENPICMEEPAPVCIVDQFGASSVDIKFSVWVRQDQFRNLKDSLMEDIKELFDKEGVEIPFPHISVYAGSETGPFPIKMKTDTEQDDKDHKE